MPEPILIAWRPAELWRRLVAKGIDALLFVFLLPLTGLGIQAAFYLHNIGPFALGLALFPVLEIVLVKFHQGTPGKRMLGLRVLRVDTKALSWQDSIQREILLLVLVVTLSLQIGSVLPALPGDIDQMALAQALQNTPSNWAIVSDFTSALLLGSFLLVLFRPDHRSLPDIWAGTVVVRPSQVAPKG
ncbi:MAG TPA: RDD family protein [Fibrobacteria bacterium]|nr:RDD family protein [Fibrobacteria bacterium]